MPTTERSIPPTAADWAQARRRGQVAVSPELTGLGALAGALAAAWFTWPVALERLIGHLASGLSGSLADGAPRAVLMGGLGVLVELGGPVLAAAFAGALAAGLAQSRGVFPLGGQTASRGEDLMPWGLLRLGRAGVLLGGGAVLLWLCLRNNAPGLLRSPYPTPWPALGAFQQAAAQLAAWFLLLLGALAALDLLARWYALRQALARTPSEARGEARERHGDPARLRERRRLHRELVGSGGLVAVRERARLVVAGPGLAVALEYRHGEMAAPRVMFAARGEGVRPLLRAAWEAGVEVRHDPALAHDLEALGQGSQIPAELYGAVAQTLSLS